MDPPAQPRATSAIDDVLSTAAEFAPGEVETENGVQYVRTQLELELESDATVAEMDALLAQLGATVVSSLAGVGILTVEIPDPGSLDALRDLVAGLAGTPGLLAADLVTVPAPTELPSNLTLGEVGMVRPQLASRAHAAWNARGALASATLPTLVIADFFGAGPPGAEVAGQTTSADYATNNLLAHGYTITGLALGTFAPGAVAGAQADQVAGLWPGPALPLRAIDLRRSIAGSTADDRILQMIRPLAGDVVVNSSYEDGCARAGCTTEQIATDARQWIRRVRESALESRFLHVVAVGNIYPDLLTDTQAVLGSHYIAAALNPPAGHAALTNTITVENTTSSDPASGAIRPLCMTATSKEGGHISAVGNDIKSFGAPGVFRDLPAGGTSSAAPQVAGAAALVWALAPALSPSQVLQRLTHTAREIEENTDDPRCKNVAPAPALDAHAAALSADGAIATPAREAILDVADGSGNPGTNGAFDEEDLEDFRDAFIAAGGAVDYGRFDLNGDGRTGGGRARIDLDALSLVEWTFSRRRPVLGLEVGHDENDARDLDVLCHEAAGPLYTGNEEARDLFHEQFCVPPVEIAVDPAFPATVNEGSANPLRIEARRTDLTDPAVSQQPGVRLEYTVTGGSVGDVTGVTGQDGAFTTDVTLLDPAEQVEVDVTARAGEEGPVLDSLTVVADRGAGPVVVEEGGMFLVANAEADDDVFESDEATVSSTVSAADKDATANASGSSTLTLSSGGMTFTGDGTASASDDGGGGDALSSVTRRFVVSEDMLYRIEATLSGVDADEEFGRVQLYSTGASVPFFSRTTSGSQTVPGFLGAGDYTIVAEFGCTPPRPDGGSCSGSFDFDLDLGDFVS